MSTATAVKPKAPGIGGGWLSMAPEIDEIPVAASTSSHHQLSSSSSPRTHSPMSPPSTTTVVHPSTLTSYAGYQHPLSKAVATAPSQVLPRTNARFQIGDSSQITTPSSPAPESPYSRGSDYDSPPLFDVRSSFAPMPKWGGVGATATSSKPAAATAYKGRNLVNGSNLQDSVGEEIDTQTDEDDSNDPEASEPGIHYGGVQWKGKTAHAVELEMEALGDRTIMSYAPDAVYLASRLEGLKRNLEAGGKRLHRWAWQDFEDVEQHQDEEDDSVNTDADQVAQSIDTKDEGNVEQITPALEVTAIDSAVSSLSASEGATPKDEVMEDPMLASKTSAAVEEEGTMHDIVVIPNVAVDSTVAAKAAALDARVDIRTLRRPDLEQIRELHCYHGEGDKVDAETYTTSAGFLLRLLVDEHHVCLVAVAKPLPEPPTLPTRFSPGAPPPSLDIPASKTPYLMAGQSRTAGGVPSFRKFVPLSSSRLVPAPRSFGVGTNSSSSSMDEDEEEEREESGKEKAETSAADLDLPGKEKAASLIPIAENKKLPSPSLPSSHSRSVLAGPTHDVAPPRTIRVMGAPPLNGLPLDSETILGVASARIKVVQRSEGDDIFGKTESLDASWPGLDSKGGKSKVTREAHIITLSIVPGERGQGLGARLLDLLLDECKRRTAGPRIYSASGSTQESDANEALAPRVHENAPMRTFLEVHPTNRTAIALYESRNFHRVPGSKGVIKHYFRGDNRIPTSIRVQVGGSDAIRLERFDFK
ncbi:hypothetical protein CBS101457_002590 [Exobasidium rhododendri]|nr:hypothetical protein CBS101457_002590 [Exobasidium rhododendri]